MKLAIVGVSHKKASVDIRGKVAFTESMKDKVRALLEAAGITEVMILSTCNRSEVYVAHTDSEAAMEVLSDCYVLLAGEDVEAYLYKMSGAQALTHLFRVACGLDSLVLGEDQILGQLKNAGEEASEAGCLGKHLGKAVREAVTFSKKTRTKYKFSENQLSVAAIGVKYLREQIGSLKDVNILLIGTGSMGQLILKYLMYEEVGHVYITNRTYREEQFEAFISDTVTVVDYNDRYQFIDKMDVVISATASPHMVVSSDSLEITEDNRDRIFLDMAVPRDIDPRIGHIHGTKVVTIDDFNQIAGRHIKRREAIAEEIEHRIQASIVDLDLWLMRSRVDDVISLLRKRQEKAVAMVLCETEAFVSDHNHKAKMEAVLKRAMWSIIKDPINQLKEMDNAEDIDRCKTVLEQLFE